MSKILDLEQRILELGTVSDDIKTVYEYVSEEADISAKENDTISVVLLGIANLYNMKFNLAFEAFEALCAEHGRLKKELDPDRLKRYFEEE